jgi:hypothetical protein
MTWRDLFDTKASEWTILVRLLVGLVVFFPEGLQKLLFPEILGAGRFRRHRDPVSRPHGAVRRRLRDRLRCPHHLRIVHTACGNPADHHHDRGYRLDEATDLGGPRRLDFPSAEAFPLRLLEHGTRSAR